MSEPLRIPREVPRRARPPRDKRREPPKAPLVQVHAHRGGAKLAPENTMAAFENAVTLGAHAIELDVRRCRTGELLVFHDATLQRLCGRPELLSALSLGELQSIDVGSHFSPEYSDQRIPTLAEVLETLRNQIRFNIEIKEESAAGDGTASAVGELIERMGMYPDCIVSSFNPLSLLRVGRRCLAPLGLIYPGDSGPLWKRLLLKKPWTAPIVAAYAVHPRQDLVDAELVRQAHARGLAVNTWTVDDEARIRELVRLRVTGIISDRPDVALRVVGEMDPKAA